MPSVSPGVHIKATRSVRIIRVVPFTVFCFFLAGAGAGVAGGGTFLLFLVILWPLGIALALVINRARLTATGDVLTYQGPLRTRAWQREEIAVFWLDRPWGMPNKLVHIGMGTATGEQVAFRAIQASWTFDRGELDRWRAALWDWLEAADDPARG